jgi:hypothetical protein
MFLKNLIILSAWVEISKKDVLLDVSTPEHGATTLSPNADNQLPNDTHHTQGERNPQLLTSKGGFYPLDLVRIESSSV